MPPLRAVYTDLDGTLLGRYGSLFNDADGEFTMLGARAVEACHRAEAELVLMSGRREAQVASDSRILGQTSYIYEAGCAVMIDGERTVLLGDFEVAEDATVYESIVELGIPDLLFESFSGPLAGTKKRGTISATARSSIESPTAMHSSGA